MTEEINLLILHNHQEVTDYKTLQLSQMNIFQTTIQDPIKIWQNNNQLILASPAPTLFLLKLKYIRLLDSNRTKLRFTRIFTRNSNIYSNFIMLFSASSIYNHAINGASAQICA